MDVNFVILIQHVSNVQLELLGILQLMFVKIIVFMESIGILHHKSADNAFLIV